ncbi:hypothetical protein B0H11DRAFT_2290265 [Mycena galericulata]|nr:hypothetical protein B0H11DRAFT_2290265 [Mycena galericulata]
MRLGQFSSWVSVEGVNLSEFATEYSPEAKEATCWIPSQSDKNFCVTFENNKASPDVLVSALMSVDGVTCGGRELKLAPKSSVSTSSRDSVSTSATTRRRLVFGKQALTDDDENLDAAISPDFGTIKVHFRRVKRGSVSKKGHWEERNFESKPIHERSKKAIGHSVQYGAEFRRENRLTRSEKTIELLVTFVFRYRPIELLRAEGIVPPESRRNRVVSPSAEILDLTMDDDDEKAAEIERLEARLNALKRGSKETGLAGLRVKKEIKREELIFQPGEVIDLT